jgi:signal transduction histidine kinase
LTNPTQFHQILLNLCINAAHAMHQTGGVLEVTLESVNIDAGFVSTHPQLQPGMHMRLTVQDTGHGIAPHLLKHIFEPFFTTKQPGEGTGLGLTTVQHIVTSHGGTVMVTSLPGEGTTFAVYIPCITHGVTQDLAPTHG